MTTAALSHSIAFAWAFVLPVSLCSGACGTRPMPRYIVTTTPMNLVGAGHPGICLALDSVDARQLWWWEPGPSGCATRSTGPTVFAAHLARRPALTTAGDIEVHFQLQLMSGVREVPLLWQDGGVSVRPSGPRVSTERRANLEIPSAYGG